MFSVIKIFPIKDLSELLLEYTDGVPGLIVGAVSVLLKYVAATPNISFTRESIESILSGPTNAEKCVAPYYLSRLEGLSDKGKVTMKRLILSHLYCVQFRVDDTLRESGQDNAHVFDLLLACFLEIQLEPDTLSALLFRTIRALSVHFLHESRCRVLEGFVATKFYLSFALRCCENSLLSTLSQLSRLWSRMDLEFPTNSAAFHVMPSIHFQKASKGQEGSTRKRTTFGPNEWERFVEEELPYNEIHIPIHATFNGPDILLKLRGHTNDETLLVGIACKGRWSSRGIG
ncbi:hypothetical protein GAYE_SCF39G5281 [Galdieria yellowstonensis]|uniref:Uncharacterized protein n=1 Tax=Galdieria yellowstonensis TaxID=3028027 RepID=A0AAV9IJ68_9RHOD|nr:hypothetical protein GAYE_SCF39G5281 [Galdieria yellowstonensis]